MEPKKFSYESMGTHWEITIWDPVKDGALARISENIKKESDKFDNTYSRFIKHSLVSQMAQSAGTYEVPKELVEMLRLYQELNLLSNGKINPLVGFALSDLGYDAEYSLQKKNIVRKTPDLNSTIKILSATRISLEGPALIDIGALGKGYFVDIVYRMLEAEGFRHFLVNGSGDVKYKGPRSITAGLEHPSDKTKVIGTIAIKSGALCASGIDRRKWGDYNHMLDPHTNISPKDILSTWVLAPSATMADALASCLFFLPPETLLKKYNFEYCVLDKEMRAKSSAGFRAQFF